MIRLVYPTDPNFGDAMSPFIVEKLSGHKVVPSAMWNADMMAVGSVFYRGDYFMADTYNAGLLRRAKAAAWDLNRILSRPITVWGAGFLQYPPFKKPHFCRKLNILALRGHYTRRILEQYGLMKGDEKIAYGDPGLLFVDLFGIKPDPKYDIGIIPHKYDIQHGCIHEIESTLAWFGVLSKVINVADVPIKVVSEIAQCKKIISASLHGLIVADSLGIPNLHVCFSSLGHSQEDYELKFRDYYSAYGVEMPPIVSGKELLAEPARYVDDQYYGHLDMDIIQRVKNSLRSKFPCIQ